MYDVCFIVEPRTLALPHRESVSTETPRESCGTQDYAKGDALYRSADKSLARPGRKQTNVSVRMARISFGALPFRGEKKT